MTKPSSRQTPAGAGAPPRPSTKGMLVLLLGGVGMVLLATVIAQRSDLRTRLNLDFRGERVKGKAERQDNGLYRISYKHPGGAIEARSNYPGLGMQSIPNRVGLIEIRYDPGNSNDFQPAGMSYVPASASLVFFLAGMTAVIQARRMVLRRRRLQRKQVPGEADAHEKRK